MTEESQADKKRAIRCLEEALSGQSPKSKKTLIKEALKAVEAIK